jgi:hypothetical protein
MKELVFLLLVAASSVLSQEDSKHYDQSSTRLCPTGYRYAGEDTPPDVNTRDVYYKEVHRTPVYSCYKLVPAATTWLSAMHACWDDDAQLVSFEDVQEMQRVTRAFFGYNSDDDKKPDGSEKLHMDALTSGMFFEDKNQWYWIGANASLRADMPVSNPSTDKDVPRDCLLVSLDFSAPPEPRAAAGYDPSLTTTSCFDNSPYMCEARVQTVTYSAWFVANWLDMLLGFLLVILFVALCISVCAHNSNETNRSRAAAQQRNRQRNNHNHPDYPATAVIDLPPSYDSTVRVHKPVQQSVTVTSASPSRVEYYKTRGKELLAKVYVYKDTTPANKH